MSAMDILYCKHCATFGGLRLEKRRGDMLRTARPTRVYLLVPVLLPLRTPIPGSRSDAKGNYVALGFGLESGQTVLQARSNGLELPYRHWMTGYHTPANQRTKATVDMRGTTDIDDMLGLLAQYGIQHRRHSFSRAVASLVADLYPKRMTHMPHKHERLP